MHDGHRSRMRERFDKGSLDSFADHEVLEMLLFTTIARKNVNPVAHDLLEKFGSLSNVFRAGMHDLMSVSEIGESTARLIVFVGALHKRLSLSTVGAAQLLDTPEKAAAYAQKLMCGCKNEQFYVLLLDSKQKLLCAERISEGIPNQTTVYARTVVEAALRHGAAYALLAHNHPGGSIVPSQADMDISQRIANALETIDVRCVEHFIVTDTKAYAIFARRILDFEHAQ